MRLRLLTILLVAIVTHIWAADDLQGVKAEAQKCADALMTNNFETVITYTHKRVVAGMGGKEAVIAKLKKGVEEMRSQGIRFARVEIGDPQKPKTIGDFVVTLLPEKIVLTLLDGYLHQESYLLGISEDKGKKWVFVSVGPITQEQFDKFYPEFKGQITLPEKKEPVFRKDDGSIPLSDPN